VRIVNFADATGHNDCYYLPFRENNITSIRIGTAANRFFTDNLSGCSIFIDQMPGGDLVVYHANRQGAQYKPTETQAADVLFEREVAIAVKKQLHDNAKTAAYAGATDAGSLFKQRYNAGAARHNNIQRFVSGTDQFTGGTTVVGFRSIGGWEFHYQTWHGNRVLGTEKFYP